MTVGSLESHLNEEGYTLGYRAGTTQVTIAELLTSNSSNLLYRQYGHPHDFCLSLTVTGKKGQVYRTKRVPRSATGPDFRQLLLEGRQQFGTIEEVVLRIHPFPEATEWHLSYWETELDGEEFVRELGWIHLQASFIGIHSSSQQPRLLRHDKKILVALRLAGPEELIRCYLKRASQLAKQKGGMGVRRARKKEIAWLGKLMEQGTK